MIARATAVAAALCFAAPAPVMAADQPSTNAPGDMEVARAWQVMSAIHNHIATHKDKEANLPIKDDKNGETLPLQFVEITPAGAPPEEGRRIFRVHRLP